MHNWKNIFRKPTLEDYITLFIIFLALFSYYQYSVDINNIIEYYEGGGYCSNQIRLNNQEIIINPLLYLENISIDSLDEPDGG